jgi:hypothetical protein
VPTLPTSSSLRRLGDDEMTPKEFASAISRLTVQAGPDGFATGRPIYSSAGGAFKRAGPGVWSWFCRRDHIRTEAAELDEGAVRAEFVAWLKTASEKKIVGFIDAAERYRPALITAGKEVGELVLRQRAAYGEVEPKFERGVILRGAEGRVLWQKAQLAAREIAQRSEAGEQSGKSRGAPARQAVLDLAKKELSKRIKKVPSRWEVAGIIATRLNHAPEQKQVDRILSQLAGSSDSGLPSEWIPLRRGFTGRNRSP